MARTIERSVAIKAKLIHPNPWNPYANKSDRLQDAIAESIGEFDQIQDLVVRPHPGKKNQYQILDGEGRHRTFHGDAEIFCTVIHGLTDAQAKKITIVMDETRANADQKELNALLAELSEDFSLDELMQGLPYEEDYLAELISMGDGDFSVFDGEYLDEPPSGSGDNPKSKPPIEEDGFEPSEDPEYIPRVKAGEIWKLGRHYIACGDCTIASNVKKLFDGRSAQLIHADPPYGMGKEKDGVANDNLYGSKLDAFQMLWWNEGRKYLDENGSVYIWGNAEDLWRLWFVGGLKDSERLTLRNEIVWDKANESGLYNGNGIGSSTARLYANISERCLFFMRGEQGFNNNTDNYWEGWDPLLSYLHEEAGRIRLSNRIINDVCGVASMYSHWFTRSQWTLIPEDHYRNLQVFAAGKAFKREYEDIKREYEDIKREYEDIKREWYSTRAYFNNTHDNMTDVWKYPRVKGEERWGHATPKPTVMMQRIYKSSCPANGLIYSPFLGSGSDLIAAEQLGDRTVIGFELSNHYCSLICDRWEKLTGLKAEKIGDLPNL